MRSPPDFVTYPRLFRATCIAPLYAAIPEFYGDLIAYSRNDTLFSWLRMLNHDALDSPGQLHNPGQKRSQLRTSPPFAASVLPLARGVGPSLRGECPQSAHRHACFAGISPTLVARRGC